MSTLGKFCLTHILHAWPEVGKRIFEVKSFQLGNYSSTAARRPFLLLKRSPPHRPWWVSNRLRFFFFPLVRNIRVVNIFVHICQATEKSHGKEPRKAHLARPARLTAAPQKHFAERLRNHSSALITYAPVPLATARVRRRALHFPPTGSQERSMLGTLQDVMASF